MNTFLQFFTEGRRLKFTREIQDKIVAYKKENPSASFDDIGKIFNASSNMVYKIISKNWPEWKKSSTIAMGKPSLYNQEIQDKVVAYKKENPGKTLREIGEVFNASHGVILKILNKNWPGWKKSSTTKAGKPAIPQKIKDEIVAYKKENPDKGTVQIGSVFNMSYVTVLDILNKNWPEWKKSSTVKAGRPVKPGSSVGGNIKSDNNTKPKIFTDVQSELDYYKSLIIKLEKEIEDKKAKGEDTSVGKIAAEFNVPREVVHIAKHGADKNTDDSDEKEDYDYIGKITDRKNYFKVIKPEITKMGENINVLSLPHNYKFEDDLLKQFNLNKINSYGFNLKKFKDKQIDFAREIYQKSGGKIVPHMNYINANTALLKSNKFDKFKKLVPHGAFSGGFIRPTKIPNEKFDIIDLDFKQFPGTRGSMRPKTKPDRDINPWFAPVYAARDFLKPGGLLMVTYVANSYRKQNMGEPTFLTMIQNPGNKMSQYLNTDQNVDKNFILNPLEISPESKEGFIEDNFDDESIKKHYPDAAKVGNIYTKNILAFATTNGITLQPKWVNIYPGSLGYFMYRGVFLKQ